MNNNFQTFRTVRDDSHGQKASTVALVKLFILNHFADKDANDSSHET